VFRSVLGKAHQSTFSISSYVMGQFPVSYMQVLRNSSALVIIVS